MLIIKYSLWAITGILLVGSLIPLFRTKKWWLRAWTYGRLQKTGSTLLVVALYFPIFGLKNILDLGVAIAAIIILVICLRDILPFSPLGKKQVRKIATAHPNNSIKLFVANVLMDNKESKALLKQISTLNPDVVFLVETDRAWEERCKSLEAEYSHKCLLPLDDYNGMLLYSKLPISDVLERRIVQDHVPSIRMNIELKSGHKIRFYGLHPRPPRPEDEADDLDKELLFIANEVSDKTSPVIVTGDLNDVGWSTTTKRFLKTSGLLDPRRGRGLFNSYNAKIPIIRWPLDHIFHSPHFDLLEIKRLKKFGSDHFPIYIHLAVEEKNP